MAFMHGLYGSEFKDAIEADKCTFEYIDSFDDLTPACEAHWDRFQELTMNVNTYDVYRKCFKSGLMTEFYNKENPETYGTAYIGEEKKSYKKYYTMADYTPWLYHEDHHEAKKMVEEIPPCVYGSYVVDYLNLNDTRSDLHIPLDVQPWTYCADNPNWFYTSGRNASYAIYEEMFAKHPDIKILVYSGDTDGSVPTWGSLKWIESLNQKVTSPWTHYDYDN